jgi:hypothetical protein
VTRTWNPKDDRGSRPRWWLASQINRLPRTCWPHLVSWALHSRRLTEVWDTESCRREAGEMGNCYCWKYRGSRDDQAVAP